MMAEDPIVNEVREVRKQLNIAAKYDLDELARRAKECVLRLGLNFCSLKAAVDSLPACPDLPEDINNFL